MTGNSRTNLKYMRQFASSWPHGAIGPQPVGQSPWGHIRCLLDKLNDQEAAGSGTPRAHGRAGLVAQAARTPHRFRPLRARGTSVDKLLKPLPAAEREMVQQIVHEDYNFECLGLGGSGAARCGRRRVLHRHALLPHSFEPLRSDRAQARQLRPHYAGQVTSMSTSSTIEYAPSHHEPTIGLVLLPGIDRSPFTRSADRPPGGVARYKTASTLPCSFQMSCKIGSRDEEISAGVQRIVERHAHDLGEAESDRRARSSRPSSTTDPTRQADGSPASSFTHRARCRPHLWTRSDLLSLAFSLRRHMPPATCSHPPIPLPLVNRGAAPTSTTTSSASPRRR